LNQKEERKIKTHEEIAELLKELELLEERFTYPELVRETRDGYEVVEEVPEETEELPSGNEVKEETEKEPELEKRRSIFSVKLRRRKKLQKPEVQEKHQRIILWRTKKQKFKETEKRDETLGEATLTKKIGEVTTPTGTFTLRIDDEGNLIGFNIKKPRPKTEKKQRRMSPFKQKKGTSEEAEVSGRLGKLKGLFSRVRKSKETGGESEKTGIKTKLSGLLSRVRRSKK